MSLAMYGAGFVTGVIVGVGLTIFYLRYKMKSQLNVLQKNMQDMVDVTSGMEDISDQLSEAEFEEVEKEDKE